MNDRNPATMILVVDDEPNVCKYLVGILAQEGWRVETAVDGRVALALMERQHYDAVVLDYRMPDMNGAELTREMDRLQPAVPKILLTGYPTIDTVYPAVEAGVDRVLAKPFDPQELVEMLRELIAGSKMVG